MAGDRHVSVPLSSAFPLLFVYLAGRLLLAGTSEHLALNTTSV